MPWTSVSSPCPSPHVLSPPSKHPKGKSQVQGTIYGITHAKMKKNMHEKWMKKCLEHSSGPNAQPLSPTPRKQDTTRPFCASAWLHRIWLQSVPGKMMERCGKHKLLQTYIFICHLSWPSNVQKSLSLFRFTCCFYLSWLSLATGCTVCSWCLDYRQYFQGVQNFSMRGYVLNVSVS